MIQFHTTLRSMNKEVMEWATCFAKSAKNKGNRGFDFFVSPQLWPQAALANASRANLLHIRWEGVPACVMRKM